ncbi:MAG: hypothetical protein AAF491_10635 [Verrucomicrobiota bacterium]
MVIDLNLIDRLGTVLIWVGGAIAIVFLFLTICLVKGVAIRVSPTGRESLHLHDAFYVTSSPPQFGPTGFALIAALLLIASGWNLKKHAASLQGAAGPFSEEQVVE